MTKKTKPDTGEEKKQSLLSQDISLASIKEALSARRKRKGADGTMVPDNSNIDFKPSAPEVNLLPPRVKEQYAAQDLGKKFVYAGGGLLAILGILFATSIVSGNIYDAKIQEVESTTAQVNTEISSLQPYAGYRTSIEAKRTALAGVTANQVNVAEINNRFNKAVAAAGFDVSSASLALSTGAEGGGGACVNPNPFEPAQGIGCVTFSLSGNGELADLYNEFNDSKSGFVNIFIPSATTSEEGATLDGSVSVLDVFGIEKYAELSLPLNQVLPNPSANENPAPATDGEAAPEGQTAPETTEGAEG